MLHHFSNCREYWFCRNCWQEMPNLEGIKLNKDHRLNQIVKLSSGSLKSRKRVAVGIKEKVIAFSS